MASNFIILKVILSRTSHTRHWHSHSHSHFELLICCGPPHNSNLFVVTEIELHNYEPNMDCEGSVPPSVNRPVTKNIPGRAFTPTARLAYYGQISRRREGNNDPPLTRNP